MRGVLDGDCTLSIVRGGDVGLSIPLDGQCGTRVNTANYYRGQTTVSPSFDVQRLNTGGLIVPTDIIINPIPSNYGLITWDGSSLTVS